MKPLDERAGRTFRLERTRSIAAGVLETAGVTFLILIAERCFRAGPAAKGLLQSGGSLGLLLSPLLVAWALKRRLPAERAAAWLCALGATTLSAAVVWPVLPVFLAGAMPAFLGLAGSAPFFSSIYEANYPADRRGELFSRNIVVRILAGLLFAWLAGRMLEANPENFRWVLAAYVVALAVCAVCLWRCPSVPLVPSKKGPLAGFRYAREDPVFRWTLISWMLMGTGNLVMLPLRVEYLAGERYGLRLGPEDVALLTAILPNAARLAFTRVWGRLFDRMNFFTMRIVLNTGFMLGIVSFFTGGGMAGLVTGALLFGISNAGGDLAWSLWVIKIAPPGRVTDYMAVHTFLTGVRGVAAPFLAFYCAMSWGVGPTALAAAGMILAASLMLVRERKRSLSASVAPPEGT